jgi:hypothetical protein
MKKLIFSLLVFLTGCQSMGEHFTCLDEANRITRTEQRFVRTETKCVRSDQQSLGGGQGTIYNPGRGDVNCTSTPIYETVILNQSERDTVYQNCRNRINNQTQRSQQRNIDNYKCTADGEINCQKLNMKCVSSGATQWCSR